MTRFLRRARLWRLLVGASVLALTFAAGSIVTAFGGDAPVFQACLTSGGTLTNVTTDGTSPNCGPTAQLVTWNSQGAQGPPGADGATHAYVVHAKDTEPQPYGTILGSASDYFGQPTRRLVASLTDIPAGAYVVTASESAISQQQGVISCTLSPGGAQSVQGFTQARAQAHFYSVVVTDVVTLQNTSDIGLTCNGPGYTSSISAVITAIQVQSASELQMPAISNTPSLTGTTTGTDTTMCTATIIGSGLMPGSDVYRQNTDFSSSLPELLGPANADGTFSLEKQFALNTHWSFLGVDPQNQAVNGTYVCQ